MVDPWEPFRKNYTIHKESEALLGFLGSKNVRPFSTYTVDEARKVFTEVSVQGAGDIKFDGQVQEIVIPSPHPKGGVPISVYKPSKVGAKPSILIYFHGGGLVLFDRKCIETVLKKIALDSGSVIVNVEYPRLRGECSGYETFDSAVVVTKWVLENKKSIGGHQESKVGIGGDSSGGQIAISVTNDVQNLAFVVMVYPHCDTSLKKPSVKEFEFSPVLPGTDLKWFVDLVIKDLPNQETDPRICPLARTNLQSFPPTLIITAELDPLRDGGMAFGEKLKAAGVNVKASIIKGVPHIFFGMLDIFKTKCPETIDQIVKFLSEYQ